LGSFLGLFNFVKKRCKDNTFFSNKQGLFTKSQKKRLFTPFTDPATLFLQPFLLPRKKTGWISAKNLHISKIFCTFAALF